MQFISTRGRSPACGFRDAIATGLAPDGGLFLPDSFPDLRSRLPTWESLSYPALCLEFFKVFAGDEADAALESAIKDAYSRFEHPEIAPLVPISEQCRVMELFHGPTLAFKDFALQVLGNLYADQIQRSGLPIHVLGATSGDTGAAAIAGLLGKSGVHTFILYPKGRTSELQERQMTCTGDPRVFPLAIDGSFDDAQAALKKLFGDHEFRRRTRLSAVNSINLARILAQSVYYLHAWFQLPPGFREEMEVVVPTGNFGNVFSGWILRSMGVPIPRFRVAVNRNDILHRMIAHGDSSPRAVAPSLAPSMDIQVPSNFERFFYCASGRDSRRVRDFMQDPGRQNSLPDFGSEGLTSSRAGDADILNNIRIVYDKFGYLCDPHTASAFSGWDAGRPSLILATAHPAKFPETINRAIGITPTHEQLESLRMRVPTSYAIDPTAEAIGQFILDHPSSL